MQLRLPIAILFSVSLLTLQGCAHTAIRQPTSSEGQEPNAIRTLGPDQRFLTLPAESVARRVRAQRAGQPVNILALSGGGADGAFGAGALVGLTRSALRPQFSVVTGVSTGALIAPYAFLGPDWDDQLVEVYTSGRAEHLLHSRGLGVLFGSSVYSGAPLKDLVDRYATDALIQAVAREASTGRLLLVATTDVSTGEPVIWDLGSIAMNGGAGARALFRDVLVASASVPGLFPPVVIRVQEQQALYDEVHVDGTIAVPFFVPLAFVEARRDATDRSQGTAVYVLVDGRLSEQPAAIRMRARSILSRSVSAGLNHMLRTTLELTATDAELQGAQFQFAAIPVAYPQVDSFDFSTPTMRSLFQFGYRCAQAGRLWTSSRGVGVDAANRDDSGAGPPKQCPADDASISRLAVR
ncbi:MAG TPA: patatin-like phospholipase family protein [Steroidobacteraceae bacterium]|jgi:predicted acylesterase/phospholipase RssA|nr:patatin-like phospholipase family protein [Steroidobacteraceae bacterium]